VEFGVEIAQYRHLARVPRRVFYAYVPSGRP